MMKAMLLNKNKLKEQQVPIPNPAPGEIQVKLLFSGVCRSDLNIAKGEGLEPLKKDLILGHEGCGVVSLLGNGVTSFKPGDLVVVPWFGGGCGNCDTCLSEESKISPYCKKVAATGCRRDGTYAEYVVVNETGAVKVPDGMNPQQATPLACAGLTSFTALKESGVQPDQWMVIMGAAGGLGHLAMQFATKMGMKTVGIDLGADKVKFIRELGFKHAVDGSAKDWENQLQAIIGEEGPHGVFVAAPSEKAYQQALQVVRKKGVVIAVSLPKDAIKLPIRDIVLKGVRFVGSLVGTQEDLKETLDFALKNKVHCVIHECEFKDLLKVHADLEKNKFPGRAVLCVCPHDPKVEEAKREYGAPASIKLPKVAG